MEQNTVFKKELYSMSGFNVKRIFQQEKMKTWQNAVLKLQWSKTRFLRKICLPSGNLMQNNK